MKNMIQSIRAELMSDPVIRMDLQLIGGNRGLKAEDFVHPRSTVDPGGGDRDMDGDSLRGVRGDVPISN